MAFEFAAPNIEPWAALLVVDDGANEKGFDSPADAKEGVSVFDAPKLNPEVAELLAGPLAWPNNPPEATAGCFAASGLEGANEKLGAGVGVSADLPKLKVGASLFFCSVVAPNENGLFSAGFGFGAPPKENGASEAGLVSPNVKGLGFELALKVDLFSPPKLKDGASFFFSPKLGAGFSGSLAAEFPNPVNAGVASVFFSNENDGTSDWACFGAKIEGGAVEGVASFVPPKVNVGAAAFGSSAFFSPNLNSGAFAGAAEEEGANEKDGLSPFDASAGA